MSTVALVRCDSYRPEEVEIAIDRGFALLGGAMRFFSAGESIVLKPNILSATAPEYHVTTHPSVFAAVAGALQRCGVRCSYGDSPATGKCAPAARAAGLDSEARRLGIECADFDSGKKVRFPSAKANATFPIANGVLSAGGVVSLPKLKTHNLTRITGAVKNQYGCIPGSAKAQFHARFLLPQDFSEFAVDITRFVRPRLYIMDAIVAMEGNGPNGGDGKNLGVLLLSTDPVAMDAIACEIIDLDPAYVPTCVAGQRSGLGTHRRDEIECVGDPISEFIDAGFNVTRRPPFGLTGSGLRRHIKELVAPRPRITAAKCTRCGHCVDICPVSPGAVAWVSADKKRPPRYDYSRCIRCYCCQEACPSRAISVKTPLLGKGVPFLAGVGAFAVSMKHRLQRRLKKRLLRPRGM